MNKPTVLFGMDKEASRWRLPENIIHLLKRVKIDGYGSPTGELSRIGEMANGYRQRKNFTIGEVKQEMSRFLNNYNKKPFSEEMQSSVSAHGAASKKVENFDKLPGAKKYQHADGEKINADSLDTVFRASSMHPQREADLAKGTPLHYANRKDLAGVYLSQLDASYRKPLDDSLSGLHWPALGFLSEGKSIAPVQWKAHRAMSGTTAGFHPPADTSIPLSSQLLEAELLPSATKAKKIYLTSTLGRGETINGVNMIDVSDTPFGTLQRAIDGYRKPIT